jgi:hypothetical protein
VSGVEEVCEEEADELEGHRDHGVPDETEYGADREAIDVDIIRAAESGSEDCGFPIWRCCVCGGLFVSLLYIR